MSVYFHNEDNSYVLPAKRKVKSWLKTSIEHQKMSIGTINVVFCSDQHLLVINKEYLNHDYYTDIITFNYCEAKQISGDLFISIDRVKENASNNSVSFMNELYRVIVHGVLHLLGYGDKEDEEKIIMRALEDKYLELVSRETSK